MAPSSKKNIRLPPLSENITSEDRSPALVFFDLETSGLNYDCYVLEIEARSGNQTFYKYITPINPIPKEASEVNGLTNINGDLFLNGEKVPSYSAKIVLEEFLQFLTQLGKKCVLIAHNCIKFDAPHLIRIMNEASLTYSFAKVIEGFGDTLPLFKRKFPNAKWNFRNLAAKSFSLDPEKMHDPGYDVLMLQNVACYNFSRDDLLSRVKNFRKMTDFREMANFSRNFESLEPFNTYITEVKRRKMTEEGIGYDKLVEIYAEKGQDGVKELLEKKDNFGKKIIGNKKIIKNILEHLQDKK